MNKLNYKGYGASVEYINGHLVVKVLGVEESLVARCIRPSDVMPSLKQLVDGYLRRRQFDTTLQDVPRPAAA